MRSSTPRSRRRRSPSRSSRPRLPRRRSARPDVSARSPYVLIGNSAAALAAVDWIRARDPQGQIVLVNRERGPAYSRVALPYYVSGARTLESLMIRQPADYARLGIELIDGESVAGIDPEGEVELAGGRRLAFGTGLVASGSDCMRPPRLGLDRVAYHVL